MPNAAAMLRGGALALACLSFTSAAKKAEARQARFATWGRQSPDESSPDWLSQPVQLVKSELESQSGSGPSLRGGQDTSATPEAAPVVLHNVVNHTAAEPAAPHSFVNRTATQAAAPPAAPQVASVPQAAVAHISEQRIASAVSMAQDDSVLPKPLMLVAKAAGCDITGRLPAALPASSLQVTQQGQLILVIYQLGAKSSTVAVEQRFVLKFEPQGPPTVAYTAATGAFLMVVPGPKDPDISLQNIVVKMDSAAAKPATIAKMSMRGMESNHYEQETRPITTQTEDYYAQQPPPPPPPQVADELPPPPPSAQEWITVPVQVARH